MYDLDDSSRHAFQNVYDSVLQFARCGATWHVGAQGRVYDPKYHAGAGQLINRKRISVDVHDPPYVKTNIATVRIPLGRKSLYFFPDRILIYTDNGVGAISYNELGFNIDTTRFVEDGVVPRDAKVVDHTWQYVNKNGSPDRRFNNNRQLPICLYEEVRFRSSTGLNELLQASHVGLGANLERAVGAMSEMITNARKAALARISHHFFESSRFGGTWGRERESFGRSGGESALS